MPQFESPPALPTRDDPLAAASSERLGGPAGRRVEATRRWWTPVRVTLAVSVLTLTLGVVTKAPCRVDGWAERSRDVWLGMCYSDVPYLFRERGLAAGELPYVDVPLEYPVLTGAVMIVTAVAARALRWMVEPDVADPALVASGYFFDLTALLMAVAALVTVVAVARTVPRRPWDGLLVAAAPVLLLTATINWDLLAVALASTAILAWTRERPWTAGALIGLGAAAKLFPVLLLGPLLLVSLRRRPLADGLTEYARALAAAAIAWAVVNLPAYLAAPDGWRFFWEFNDERGAEFGSPWYALALIDRPLDGDLNILIWWLLIGGFAVIALLGLVAPQPPRMAQLAFLTVAVFVLANKVWSPQYALWLLPLAVLARPRWRDLLLWQAAEVAYFAGVWLHLATLTTPDQPVITDGWYATLVAVRIVGLLWLMGVVVRDICWPGKDPVRPYLPRESVTA